MPVWSTIEVYNSLIMPCPTQILGKVIVPVFPLGVGGGVGFYGGCSGDFAHLAPWPLWVFLRENSLLGLLEHHEGLSVPWCDKGGGPPDRVT